ncbi:MAG: polyprenyl synthetase family protein [Actinomycetota bacterium]|nr:polyprenyl synthetase family protein [Actinomycetota bacterium]
MEPLSRDQVGAVLEPIADDLARIEELMVAVSSEATSFLTESTTYLTKAGGKRLRPALVVLAAKAAGGSNRAAEMTGAAIEMTHLATLYHDDVIDEADLRRGVPSANQRWGNKVAILAGDYLFAKASGLAAEVGGDVPSVLADAIAEVVEGQVSELRSTYDPARTQADYLSTIRGKTASLIEACTRLGATLAGAAAAEVESLKNFGSSFGYAFQIADDLLDIAASEDALGKPPGTDLRDGVYTLPVILAISKVDGLSDSLGSADVDVDRVRGAVVESGAFNEAREIAFDHVDKALIALKEIGEGEAREALERLTRLVVDRVPSVG